MTRPIRIEYPGALYHVTSRGNRREIIFHDDIDRRVWLDLVAETCRIFKFDIYAYCQMGNHFHLLVRTREGKLARGMRFLNGEYSRLFNLRHSHVGHLFQSRYHAIVCENEAYLLELSRYIVLNPVRAGLVPSPQGWEWSSYRAALGEIPAPVWLDLAGLLRQFDSEVETARKSYRNFVHEGIGHASPLARVKHQVVLGDPNTVREIIHLSEQLNRENLTRAQRQLLVKPLAAFFDGAHDRDAMIAEAYATLAYTMGEIGRFCGVSISTVSRAIRKHKPRKTD